jgi:hypothetical protein
VASSPRAVLDPRARLAGVRAVTKKRPVLPANRQQAVGLPADFLLPPDGHVLAFKYGVHAHDQWPVDDLSTLPVSTSELPITGCGRDLPTHLAGPTTTWRSWQSDAPAQAATMCGLFPIASSVGCAASVSPNPFNLVSRIGETR